ncbi:MAG: molybdopterin cofactor-binding domain-containing protein, partial [Pseudomonadota bacterium]
MAASKQKSPSSVGKPLPHDSAHLHVSGRAAYTDDIPEPRDLLHVAVGMSDRANARVLNIDLDHVRKIPGVVQVMTDADIPGENNYGAIVHDDPILVESVAEYAGHPLFAVAATSIDAARKAARCAGVSYEELDAILDIDTAVKRESFVLPSETMSRGDADTALERSAHRLAGRSSCGGQDQFYLESQIAMAVPEENNGLTVYSSTQYPDEVQALVAAVTLREQKDVVVICRRMGGAFGGKESQAALIACLAALMSDKTGRPCKLRLDRDDDMIMTGKRLDVIFDYDVGFEDSGVIQGIK